MANAIGIDFGTTKTMVSFLNPVTGKAELVRLGRDRDSIPTTVHQDENGELLFGEDADDLIETDPEGYCRAFKLHLGENDPVILRSGVTATTLTRRFLSHIKDECEQNVFHGKRIDAATITIPVSFSPSRKAALTRAAEGAGFTSVSFMPEPEAAGKAFLRDNPSDSFSRALVLDWGGGTLDIAIISRGEDGTIHADRHCAEGRDDVGGEEMDRGLLVNLDAMWSYGYGVSLLTEEENGPMLLREAEKVKIGLSRKESVPFRRGPKKIDVSRDKFNRIISELIDAAINLVNSALSKNKALGNPDPEAILLIGGASQLPIVRETMEKSFPQLRVISWHHSHEAVALGATEIKADSNNQRSCQSRNGRYEERKPHSEAMVVKAEVTETELYDKLRERALAYLAEHPSTERVYLNSELLKNDIQHACAKGDRYCTLRLYARDNIHYEAVIAFEEKIDIDLYSAETIIELARRNGGVLASHDPTSLEHFEVECPHCGHKENVSGKGCWTCEFCDYLFEVDEFRNVSISSQSESKMNAEQKLADTQKETLVQQPNPIQNSRNPLTTPQPIPTSAPLQQPVPTATKSKKGKPYLPSIVAASALLNYFAPDLGWIGSIVIGSMIAAIIHGIISLFSSDD